MGFTDHARCVVPADWITDVSQCLFEWQTMIGGGLALLAAFLTILVMQQQIRQAEDIEKNRQNARYIALRSTLPHYLSHICAYAKSVAQELARVGRLADNVDGRTCSENFNPPIFEGRLIDQLEKVVEAVPQPTLASLLGAILAEMQILASRSRQLSDPNEMNGMLGIKGMIESYMVQAAKLYVMAESIIPFGRGEDGSLPETLLWETVQTKMTFWNLDEIFYSDIFNTVNRRVESNRSFWPQQNDR